MQKLFNTLSKGQKITLSVLSFCICFVVGVLLFNHPAGAACLGFVGVLPILFFHQGSKK